MLRLPIFPLPVLLFPGTLLPLHIFEPRYRQMLADCLAGDRTFGIAPSGETQEAPEPGAVGCAAEVRVAQPLPDGRSNIVVRGGSRFVVSRLLDEPLPYLVALVEPFDDEAGDDPPPGDVERLREAFTRYLTAFHELADVESEAPTLAEDARALSFQVAAVVDGDLALKRRLLAERSAARRVEALLAALPRLTRSLEARLRVRRRAHRNGRGGARPDIAVTP